MNPLPTPTQQANATLGREGSAFKEEVHHWEGRKVCLETMKNTFKHLLFNPRAELLVFKFYGMSLIKIAGRLGVHHAILSRELK